LLLFSALCLSAASQLVLSVTMHQLFPQNSHWVIRLKAATSLRTIVYRLRLRMLQQMYTALTANTCCLAKAHSLQAKA
jgi:hypothetical protein